jgi:hypothetical protein
MADHYIILALRDDASSADKIQVRDKIKELPSINWHNIERMADMPQWRTAANPSVTWRILCLDATKPGSPWPALTITADQFTAWKAANLSEPAKLQARKGDDPEQILRAAGLEPVPATGDQP